MGCCPVAFQSRKCRLNFDGCKNEKGRPVNWTPLRVAGGPPGRHNRPEAGTDHETTKIRGSGTHEKPEFVAKDV
jgi:hypothetical protein